MQRCELAAECCVCNVAICPWDMEENAYFRWEAEWDEAAHEYRYHEDERDP